MENLIQNNTNYKKLDEYIEYILIPNYIQMKPRKHASNGKIETIPCIDIKYIIKNNFNDEEIEYIFKYLIENGFRIIGIRTYFMEREDENTHLYSKKEEQELFKKLKETNDKDIRNLIIAEYMRLAKYWTFVYSLHKNVNMNELESYAYEGLCKAVDNYDYTKETNFSTFAYSYIFGYIRNGLLKEKKILTAEKRINLMSKVNKYIKIIENKYQTSIHENLTLIDEVIDLMLQENEIKESQVANIRQFIIRAHPIYLDEDNIHIVDDGGVNEVLKEDPIPFIEEALNKLIPEDRFIITQRYGLEGNSPHTLEEIGKMLNKTRARIGKQESEILERLKRLYENKYGALLDDRTFSNYGHIRHVESNYDEDYDSSNYTSELKR